MFNLTKIIMPVLVLPFCLFPIFSFPKDLKLHTLKNSLVCTAPVYLLNKNETSLQVLTSFRSTCCKHTRKKKSNFFGIKLEIRHFFILIQCSVLRKFNSITITPLSTVSLLGEEDARLCGIFTTTLNSSNQLFKSWLQFHDNLSSCML